MFYFKKGHNVFEYKNKRELYNDVGFYDIAKVGIWHSYKKTARHFGDLALIYMERVKNKNFSLQQNLSFSNGHIIFEMTNWNIFDDNGVYYSIVDFIEYYEEYVNNNISYYINKKHKGWNGYGPVPGTGKRNVFNYSNNIRYPRTYNEIRNNQIIDENEPKIRSKRQSNNIVTSWLDYKKEKHKCWKSYRKTQYKGD